MFSFFGWSNICWVSLKFVVGSQGCSVGDVYKNDQFSCDEWVLTGEAQNVNNRTRKAVDVELGQFSNESDDDNDVYGIQSLKFIVHHPIIITKLGVHDVCRGSRTVVRILEATTSKEILSMNFESKPTNTKSWKLSPQERVERFHYKKIQQPYVFPKGYRGEVLLENLDSGNSRCDFANWNFPWVTSLNSSQVVEFLDNDIIPAGHHHDEEHWKSRPVHLVTFAFVIHDIEELRGKIINKTSINEEIKMNITKETELLHAEILKHEDVVFVDVVDVYRNLPDKLLLFSQWVHNNMKFLYMLKADDDCFIDIERIIKRLDALPKKQNVWIGRFRYNWKLDRYGKWAENAYTSPIYPRFSCGSGYILSRDIIEWLSRNADRLKTYQGEDVSLGIWMSAINPNIIDEPLWSCEKECLSDMYSMPDLRPDEMEMYWSQRIKCGDPCGCD